MTIFFEPASENDLKNSSALEAVHAAGKTSSLEPQSSLHSLLSLSQSVPSHNYPGPCFSRMRPYHHYGTIH